MPQIHFGTDSRNLMLIADCVWDTLTPAQRRHAEATERALGAEDHDLGPAGIHDRRPYYRFTGCQVKSENMS